MSKKAAMFGLDARIALAIFGALSVISGAALYSAIKQSKVIRYVAQLEELNKAYDSYRLDVGSDLELYPSDASQVNIKSLVSSSVAGWSGPYVGITYVDTGIINYFTLDSNNIFFDFWKNVTWGWDATTPVGPTVCDNTDPCSVYISIHGLTTDIINAIDEYVDGAVSPQTGKIRRWDNDKLYYIANIKM